MQPFEQKKSTSSYYQSQMRADAINPAHTNVTPQPMKTPLEVQFGLTLLPARYIIRALAKSANDGASPPFLHKITGATALRDHFYAGAAEKIEHRLREFEPHFTAQYGDATKMPLYDISQAVEKLSLDGEPIGKNLLTDMIKLHGKWDAGAHAENTIQHFLRSGKSKLTPKSVRKIKSSMSEAVFETMFDTALGIGSLAYTNKMQNNVRTDIMSIYSEAVAYETGKNSKDITANDLSNSDNQIVQSTIKNYDRKRAFRYGISALPFLKLVPTVRAMQWGEVAIGSWGALWAFDILGRKPTMLENFRAFANDKLNPLYGVSDSIKSSDIINLYQQYAYRFAPENAFRSISMNDEDANRMWAQSEKVFVRIAQLMNESYNYKHTTELDPTTNIALKQADFMLPKFIYLLGHNLINARRPEWSMAFIEIANAYGMDDVRKVEAAYHNGRSIEEVLQEYKIDLNPNAHVNGISRPLFLPKTGANLHTGAQQSRADAAADAARETPPAHHHNASKTTPSAASKDSHAADKNTSKTAHAEVKPEAKAPSTPETEAPSQVAANINAQPGQPEPAPAPSKAAHPPKQHAPETPSTQVSSQDINVAELQKLAARAQHNRAAS